MKREVMKIFYKPSNSQILINSNSDYTKFEDIL